MTLGFGGQEVIWLPIKPPLIMGLSGSEKNPLFRRPLQFEASLRALIHPQWQRFSGSATHLHGINVVPSSWSSKPWREFVAGVRGRSKSLGGSVPIG